MRAPIFISAAAVAVAFPAQSFAVEYMTPEQAARALFPQATRFAPRQLVLQPDDVRVLEQAGVRPRSERWNVVEAFGEAGSLGFLVIDSVLGKFEQIGYAVALDGGARVLQTEILSYRESHGGEVRQASWRRQFGGKGAADPIELGRDIANISGATLSCRHLTEGVQRIVRIVDIGLREGRLGTSG